MLAAAGDDQDLEPFMRPLAVLRRPLDEAPELTSCTYPAPAEATARYQTFFGT